MVAAVARSALKRRGRGFESPSRNGVKNSNYKIQKTKGYGKFTKD